MHFARRWWYTVKAVACVLVRREDKRTWRERPIFEPDPVEVAYGNGFTYQHHEYGDAAEWEVLQVGYGIVHGWRFRIAEVGYP